MATNLALDDRLIGQAVKLGKHKTKRDAVNAALAEYIKVKKRLGVIDMLGKVDYEPGYDYKAERRRSGKRMPKG